MLANDFSATYAPFSNDKLVLAFERNGASGILLYDIPKKEVVELDLGIIEVAPCGIRRISNTEFAVIGGTTTTSKGLYLVDIKKPTEKAPLKTSANIDLPASIFSEAVQISFPRTHGKSLDTLSHAVFIPPKNPEFEAPNATKPPLVISIHGGPTLHIPPSLDLDTQYFTSRGFAYCHVNHAGSTGYGRAYLDDLNYSWGVKDVEDTLSCIDYLHEQGLVDRKRVGIRGRSAGGYTVLRALTTYPEVFAAGCSLFGISNLKMLLDVTHKFEAHRLFDLMVPADTAEEEKEKIFHDRSPLFLADKITKPLTLLQGANDPIVPVEQALSMEKEVKKNGVDMKLVIFEGEGHGWKMKETIKRSIEEEEELWKRTLL